METIVRKHIEHILKHMVVQQLGGGGVMFFFMYVVFFMFFYYCLTDIFSLGVS